MADADKNRVAFPRVKRCCADTSKNISYKIFSREVAEKNAIFIGHVIKLANRDK